MKPIENKTYRNNFSLQKVFSLFKLVGFTALSQVLVQVIGFACGILLIRVLSIGEYALYTLANSILGTMIVFANSGVAQGVMAESGKVWKDREQLGQVVSTGFHLRKKFIIGSLIIVIPFAIYLLLKNEASLIITTLIVFSLIPGFIATLNTSLLQIGLNLKQDIVPLQKNQLFVNLLRLALLGITVFVFPLAYVALLCAGASQVFGNFRLRKITARHLDFNKKPSKEVEQKILKFVKRSLPTDIYYCFSGQITIWLLSIFGTTTAMAQMGALGRIATVLALITVLFKILVAPRYARLESQRKILLKRFLQAVGLLLIIFSIIIIGVKLFPEYLLLLLGKKYYGLELEMLLCVVGTSISIFGGAIYALNSHRGWVLNPVLSILLNISVLAIAIYSTDVSTLKGVLYLNIIVVSVQLGIQILYGIFRISGLRKDSLVV